MAQGIRLGELLIVRDSREKDGNGWVFEQEDKKPGKARILGTQDGCLSAGDYSILGAEDLLAIERKNGFGELFGNMTPTDHRERFEREMERMADIKHKYIIIETGLNEDTLTLSVPQMYHGPPAKRVLSWLIELGIKYNVNVIFAGDCGKTVARCIFENIARAYHERFAVTKH